MLCVYIAHRHTFCSLYFCTGFWGSVEIRNNYDVPVLFKWSPKNQLNSDNFIALQSAGRYNYFVMEYICACFSCVVKYIVLLFREILQKNF